MYRANKTTYTPNGVYIIAEGLNISFVCHPISTCFSCRVCSMQRSEERRELRENLCSAYIRQARKSATRTRLVTDDRNDLTDTNTDRVTTIHVVIEINRLTFRADTTPWFLHRAHLGVRWYRSDARCKKNAGDRPPSTAGCCDMRAAVMSTPLGKLIVTGGRDDDDGQRRHDR